MKKTNNIAIGIIGGSGLYAMDGMENIREISMSTPFGKPSDNFITGELMGVKIAFLSRHGRGHRITPSEINYRANIFAFKKLGVSNIISVSAVGSLKEELKPETIFIPDQFFDRTFKRATTFFGNGIVAHISMSHPVCHALTHILYNTGKGLNLEISTGGTYICMEGPQFSTMAESRSYRSLGFDVIGMTNIPEAKLAREAEICYATLALITDYDCWHKDEEVVNVDMVIERLNRNIHKAKEIIRHSVGRIIEKKECSCQNALRDAIITDRKAIPQKMKNSLKLITEKYIKDQ